MSDLARFVAAVLRDHAVDDLVTLTEKQHERVRQKLEDVDRIMTEWQEAKEKRVAETERRFEAVEERVEDYRRNNERLHELVDRVMDQYERQKTILKDRLREKDEAMMLRIRHRDNGESIWFEQLVTNGTIDTTVVSDGWRVVNNRKIDDDDDNHLPGSNVSCDAFLETMQLQWGGKVLKQQRLQQCEVDGTTDGGITLSFDRDGPLCAIEGKFVATIESGETGDEQQTRRTVDPASVAMVKICHVILNRPYMKRLIGDHFLCDDETVAKRNAR